MLYMTVGLRLEQYPPERDRYREYQYIQVGQDTSPDVSLGAAREPTWRSAYSKTGRVVMYLNKINSSLMGYAYSMDGVSICCGEYSCIRTNNIKPTHILGSA